MTAPADIRRPVLTGRQSVAALWWPAAWHGEAARREAVLAQWAEGAQLFRFDDGDLLCWAAPRRLDCEGLGAWPLRRHSGVLCSASVEADEWPPGVSPRAGDAWLAEGGRLRALRFAHARRVDPAEWLSSDVPLIEPFDLKAPAVEAALVLEPRELREVLGPSVPADTAPATQEMLKALRAAGERARLGAGAGGVAKGTGRSGSSWGGLGGSGGSSGRSGSDGDGGGRTLRNLLLFFGVIGAFRAATAGGDGLAELGVLVVVALVVAVVVAMLVVLWPGGARPGHGPGAAAGDGRGAAGATGVTGAAGATARRSFRDAVTRTVARAADGLGRLADKVGLRERHKPGSTRPQAWRRWAARLTATMGLSSLIGARNAAYMRRVLQMFDDGQWADALRHAPPLGGAGDGSKGPGFAMGPRADLSLSQGNPGGGTAFFGSDELLDHLRGLYRKTAERMEAEGRLDEAAYIYAVLLQEKQRALDLMERHGQHAKAAELALGWDMPAEVIVRYYALAGDWRQAVRVARRDNAFAAAVVALEKRWPDVGGRMRVEWAESLAARGHPLAAIRAIWPVTAERDRAAAWLEEAEAADGPVAARALVWRANLWPETLPLRRDAIERWLDVLAFGAERAAMADELLSLESMRSAEVRRLALLLLGPSIEDQTLLTPPLIDADRLAKLPALIGDAALSADLPPVKGMAGKRAVQAVHQYKKTPFEAGTPPASGLAVHDAVPLPDGEWLLALGESGAVHVDARGRRRAHFPAPAHRLVAAFAGGSALLLAARGDETWRVTRLVLPEERLIDLGTHRFTAFSDQFDGETWTTSDGARVRVLDVQAPQLGEVLWQVGDLPGTVAGLQTVSGSERWWIRAKDERAQDERWIYALPSRRLTARDLVAKPWRSGESTNPARIHGWCGHVLDLQRFVDEQGIARIQPQNPETPTQRCEPMPAEGRHILALSSGWLMCWVESDGETPARAELVFCQTAQVHARWIWPSLKPPRARCMDGRWMLFDDEGRAAALDMDSCRQWVLSSAGHA